MVCHTFAGVGRVHLLCRNREEKLEPGFVGAGVLGDGVYLGDSQRAALHITDYAPLWTTPGKSAFVIYAGLNIEISFFFAVYGLMVLKIMPEDKNMKILGIPNRFFIPTVLGLSGLFVEVLLNRSNMLIWTYKFWNWPNVCLIAIAYVAPLLALVWLHDNLSLGQKRLLWF